MATPRYVWIGPVSARSPEGEIGRRWLRALSAAGVEVAALDPSAPVGQPVGDGELGRWLAGPVLTRGAVCVYFGSIADVRGLADAFPAKAAERRIAHVVIEEEPRHDELEALAGFDEVWVGSTLEREALSFGGVERRRVHVVLPPLESAPLLEKRRNGGPLRALAVVEAVPRSGALLALEAWLSAFRRDSEAELLLAVPMDESIPEARADLVRGLAKRVDWFDTDRPRVRFVALPPAANERRALLAEVDLVVDLAARASWLPLWLDAAASGVPVLVGDRALVLDAGSAIADLLVRPDVASVRTALQRFARDPAARNETTARRPLLLDRLGAAAGARRLLGRDGVKQHASQEILVRALRELGRPTPEALLSRVRRRAFLCPMEAGNDGWRAVLRSHLSGFGPDDDVTLCLWVDGQDPSMLHELAQEVATEVERHQGDDGPADVQILLAPEDHVPWHRFEAVRAGSPA